MSLLLLILLFANSTLLVGQTDSRDTAKVVVEEIVISNDSILSSEHLQQLRQEITQHNYGNNAEDEIASRAVNELQIDGYFKAQVATLDLRVLSEMPDQRTVSATLRVDEGLQYRLQQIDFVHNKVFTSPQLRQAFAVKDHDVFDTEKIRLGLEALRKLYASEGYINSIPVPHVATNDQAATATLSLDIDEGKQFTIESLLLQGNWSEPDEAKLHGIFEPYAGGFNVSGLVEQLTAATKEMFPNLGSACNLVRVKSDSETRTVTVSVMRPAAP